MPPPAANQGSRAALVTWTVVSCILFVTATVFAIYFYVDSTKVTKLESDTRQKFADVIDEAAIAGPEINNLKTAKTSSDNPSIPGLNPSMKYFDVAVAERNFLAAQIAGADTTDPAKAADAAKTSIASAADAIKAAGGTAAPATLTDAVATLRTTLANRDNEVKTLKTDLSTANDNLQKKVKETSDQLASMNQTIDGIRQEQSKAISDETSLGSTKDDQIKSLQATADQQVKDAQEQQLKLQAQVADANRKSRDLQQQVDVANNKLAVLRVDTNKPILQQPDGHIVRLPGGNVCFIDLGYGDQISPGLTFEVFDKVSGIPAPGDPNNDDNLPKGVASIEVTHVGATSSECRIIDMTPGQAMSEGDPIVNLVYDKNTKYKFLVFGNFDLAQTGKPVAADAEIIKRLITQWGGAVTKDVNVDTDFVVLGAEPQIPEFSKDDLADAINKAKFDQATADAAAYDEIKGKAKDLRIPVLNQNRFLYFVGYYEQARR